MIRPDTVLAGRYKIIEMIGSGGMADVYKAADLKLGRPVAVKVLKQHLSEDKEFVRRFQVEGQAAASLNNPNIISIYDVGSQNGTYYIVMELINGITLKEYIRRKGMLTARETMAITAQVAVGLRAAHAKHIVHRDIKPQNIILSREGKVKVTDFGIARAITDETKTINNNAMGSVHYIAPEQAKGLMCDERSDIYSLGIVMYEMITGQVPFDKESSIAVALAHMNETMIPPSELNAECPVALEQIIFRCTQKSRERRYHNCTELLADLRIAVSSPDFNFEKQEQENLMKSDTLVFSPEEVENVRRMAAAGSAVTVVNGHEVEADVRTEHAGGARKFTSEETDRKNNRNRENTGGLFREDQREDEKNAFDRIVLLTGVIVGAIIICLIIYIVASLSGCLQNDINKKRPSASQQNLPSESYSQPDDLSSEEVYTLETIAEDDYDPETQTIVPNVVGMSLQAAAQQLKNANLNYKLSSNFIYSDDYKIGLICKQSYEEGTIVMKDSIIMIYMSQGTDKFEIKDSYVGGPISAFRNDVAKFTDIIDVEYEQVLDDNIPANTIISIDPSSGLVTNGEKIVVRYSIGPEYVLVPSLYGYTKAEAEVVLSDYGLTLGGVSSDYNDEYEENKICGQSLAPGTKVRNGSSVDIIQSLGIKMVTIPDWLVPGTERDNVIYGLKEIGVTVQEEEEYSADVESGCLIRMSVEPGAVINHNEVVTVVFSNREQEPSTEPPTESQTQPSSPELVTIPPRVDNTLVDAYIAYLSGLGFPAENIIAQAGNHTDDPNMNNIVYEQSPENTVINVNEVQSCKIFITYYVYEQPQSSSETESQHRRWP